MDNNIELLAETLLNKGVSVRRNVSGSELTTYRVGGNISYLISLTSREEVDLLSECLSAMVAESEQVFTDENVAVIGKGSNLLIDDAGFEGIVFVLGGMLSVFDDTQTAEDGSIIAHSGIALPVLARQACSLGFSGIEFYVGIPGTVGGAVAMNAGGHGKQTSDVLVSTEVLDLTTGGIRTYSLVDCEFGYRKSVFKATDMVISASYNVGKEDPIELKKRLDEIVQWRRENQPGGRNVGSVFQNPEDASAGALIEGCGLKGHRIGSAYVSEKHANFIQADNDASSADIISLIQHIQNEVLEKTGHELKTEVRYIGSEIGKS